MSSINTEKALTIVRQIIDPEKLNDIEEIVFKGS